jgi:cell division protein FtsW (lipid II flippase)
MPPINESSRWIFIGGFQFQPSEYAKIVLILITAAILGLNEKIISKKSPRLPQLLQKFKNLL